uniref:Integrase catalytic domain-containing protein n=1 Tax=Amphimedon queenslandica TaxID=400682 RepID=A0A1X7U3S5_AMPQE
MSNADALGRLSIPETSSMSKPQCGEVTLLLNHLSASIITAKHIRKWTSKDPLLSRVHHLILSWWPSSPNKDLQPYYNRREELSVVDGCILWGSWVITPPQGRTEVLAQLHETHPGVNQMKALARSYVWWPGLDTEEATIKVLKSIFSTHGIPEQILTDNGTGFKSGEFQNFISQMGIQHICTSPYHPSSNGLAERAVQTFKSTVSKLEGPMEHRLTQFLFKYRVTPQTTTNLSPAQLLMGRRL